MQLTTSPAASRGTDKPPGRSDIGAALIFILPALIGFLVFYLYPFIRGFYFSLTRYNLLGTPTFIGFDNFTRLFQDPLFWNAILVTVEYVMSQHRVPDHTWPSRSQC